MAGKEADAAASAQEKQSCLLLLRRELKNPGNYTELLWGGNTIHWPNPEVFRKSLEQYPADLYRTLLQHLEESEDSQDDLRQLCRFYLNILDDEVLAEQMETLEGDAICSADNEDVDFSIEELKKEMELLLSRVAGRRTTMEKDMRKHARWRELPSGRRRSGISPREVSSTSWS